MSLVLAAGCGRKGQLRQTPLCPGKRPLRLGEGHLPMGCRPGPGHLAGIVEASVQEWRGELLWQEEPSSPNPSWACALGDECVCFLPVWGCCGNDCIPPPHPSRVLLLPCVHLGTGAGAGLSLPKRGTEENPGVRAGCSPSVLTAPSLGSGSWAGEGLSALWELRGGRCTSGRVRTQPGLAVPGWERAGSPPRGLLLPAPVSSPLPPGPTLPQSGSHPPEPAVSLWPVRVEGWGGSPGAWQIGEG